MTFSFSEPVIYAVTSVRRRGWIPAKTCNVCAGGTHTELDQADEAISLPLLSGRARVPGAT